MLKIFLWENAKLLWFIRTIQFLQFKELLLHFLTFKLLISLYTTWFFLSWQFINNSEYAYIASLFRMKIVQIQLFDSKTKIIEMSITKNALGEIRAKVILKGLKFCSIKKTLFGGIIRISILSTVSYWLTPSEMYNLSRVL